MSSITYKLQRVSQAISSSILVISVGYQVQGDLGVQHVRGQVDDSGDCAGATKRVLQRGKRISY